MAISVSTNERLVAYPQVNVYILHPFVLTEVGGAKGSVLQASDGSYIFHPLHPTSNLSFLLAWKTQGQATLT